MLKSHFQIEWFGVAGVGHEGSGSLGLFSLEATSSNVLQVDSSSEASPHGPVHIASFALPTIDSGLRVGGIGITGDPASSPSVRRVSKSPFALAPDGHVYRLDIIYVPHSTVTPNDAPFDQNIFCKFFIQARTFLEHLSYDTTTEPGVEVDVRKIPWSDWGPKGSRLFCGRPTDPVNVFDSTLHAAYDTLLRSISLRAVRIQTNRTVINSTARIIFGTSTVNGHPHTVHIQIDQSKVGTAIIPTTHGR